jgi:ParB family transcriptional regulator, chromosome partitioning protein
MEKEQIVYKKVSELKLNEKNPRKNDNAVEMVANSIKQYGFRTPIIIDNKNVVWCGNTRLKASRMLGMEEVPCIIVKDLTQKQIRELALLDNKLNEVAEWDYNLLSLELEDLNFEGFENLDWGIEQPLEFEETDDEPEISEVEKKLCKCPVCGHINEEKAFKYYEDTK